MKRFIILIIMLLLFSHVFLFSQTPKLGWALGQSFANYIDGGGIMDFSILIYNNKYFDIRNHFMLRVMHLTENIAISLSLSEKISFGIMEEKNFRCYGYFEGGVGFWGMENKNKPFFEMPLAYSYGGGGGVELYLIKNSGVFLEAGGLINRFGDILKPGGIFQIGWRSYY
jgi:hypothetical protein